MRMALRMHQTDLAYQLIVLDNQSTEIWLLSPTQYMIQFTCQETIRDAHGIKNAPERTGTLADNTGQ